MKKLGLHLVLSAVLLVAMVGCAPEQDEPGTGQQRETTPTQPQQQQPDQQDGFGEQQTRSEYSVTLQEMNGSGVSGEATVTVDGNRVTVSLRAEGLEGDQAYPVVLHGGALQGAGLQGQPGQQDGLGQDQPGTLPGEQDEPGQQDGLGQDQPGQQDGLGQPGQQDGLGQPGQQDGLGQGQPGQQNGLGQGQMGVQQGDVSGPMLLLIPFPEAGTDGTLTFEGTIDNIEGFDRAGDLSLTIFGVARNGEVDITQPAATGQLEEGAGQGGLFDNGAPGSETTPGAGDQQDAPGTGPGTGPGSGMGPGTGPSEGNTTEP